MTKKINNTLSKEGQQRRDELGVELTSAFDEHHQKRAANRRNATIGVACLVMIGFGVLFSSLLQDSPTEDQFAKPAQKQNDEQLKLATDQHSPDKTEKRMNQVSFEVIDDEQLLAMLEDYGQPSMFAKVDGKKVVIPLEQEADRSLN